MDFVELRRENRVGVFCIGRKTFIDNFDFVQEIMWNVIIVRAESMFAYDCIEYTGYSELFEPTKREYVIPKYKFEMIRDEQGNQKLCVV